MPQALVVLPGRQVVPSQQPLGQLRASQVGGPSRRQVSEQPSPDRVLPSSQFSTGARTCPSPQMAGGPRTTLESTIRPLSTVISCSSLATTLPAALPSMRTMIAVPPRASGSRTAAVSLPRSLSGRGVLGRLPIENAGISPASPVTQPEIASSVSMAAGS